MTPNQLPPLPEPDTHCFDDDTGKDVWSYSAAQMHAYALAVLAQQAQEPVWANDYVTKVHAQIEHLLNDLITTQVSCNLPYYGVKTGMLTNNWVSALKRLHAEYPSPPAPQPAPVDERDAEIAELRAEVLAWRKQCDRLTHQVICCGVAASHPDATLTTRGAYAGKWNSGQAEEVRKLRAERDALAALQSPAPQTKGQP